MIPGPVELLRHPAGGSLPKVRVIRATIPLKHDLYLRSCARIRGITLTALMTRLADLIGQDQLVGSILDDGAEIKVRRKGENRYPNRASSAPATLHMPASSLPES